MDPVTADRAPAPTANAEPAPTEAGTAGAAATTAAPTSGSAPTTPELRRCFGGDDPVYSAYHDTEWGVELHGDQEIFERISLEIFAAGLAWLTVLRKRDAFREALAGFDPAAVARFDEADVERLMNNAGIIRNRSKIEATIHNAQVLTAWQAEGGSLDRLVWSHRPFSHPAPVTPADIPSGIPESSALTAALKKVGFKWVGPTVAYSTMQAVGVVDDHPLTCPRHTAR
ncbi:MAG: DNA-3-methyladenine glycosylase I [Bifidobacteriaceae bacterium]|jgi:DNA-3-methyladenine glycosylase I|nr:DNA-3-methyladenine glycosylase I [Bifidobacteriaceae bacterium]